MLDARRALARIADGRRRRFNRLRRARDVIGVKDCEEPGFGPPLDGRRPSVSPLSFWMTFQVKQVDNPVPLRQVLRRMRDAQGFKKCRAAAVLGFDYAFELINMFVHHAARQIPFCYRSRKTVYDAANDVMGLGLHADIKRIVKLENLRQEWLTGCGNAWTKCLNRLRRPKTARLEPFIAQSRAPARLESPRPCETDLRVSPPWAHRYRHFLNTNPETRCSTSDALADAILSYFSGIKITLDA